MIHGNDFGEHAPSAEEKSPERLRNSSVSGERQLGPALLRGWRGRCPNCGGGPILEGYLKVRSTCPSCGEPLHHHRADDMPAWATILIVGHIVGFGFFHVEMAYHPPIWLHWAVWPALAIGLTMWLLPRVKAAVVALQWSRRMHGFGSEDHHTDPPA